MSDEVRIGFVGLDTSHVSAFARILCDESAEFHVPGARVVAAYPGGSPDMERSIGRVDGYTSELREAYGVEITDTIEAVVERSDAVFLESVDGRVHREQFEKIAPAGKPVFIDKPIAVTSRDAERIVEFARRHSVVFMSSSALRYASPFVEALADTSLGRVIGIDCAGPMQIEPTQNGLFWYGIHTVEMVYAALGTGCARVSAVRTDEHDVVCGEWSDGRLATVRGNRVGNTTFTAAIHRENGTQLVDASAGRKPYYVGLLEAIMTMIRTGNAPIDPNETLEIVRFIEAANTARIDGHGSARLASATIN